MHVSVLRSKAVILVTDTVAHLIKQLYRRGSRNAAFLYGYCHVRILTALKIKGVGNSETDYMAGHPGIYGDFAVYLT